MAEFVIAHILDDYEVGGKFQMWPLHLTVLQPFEAPDARSVIEAVKPTLLSTPPVQAKIGESTQFSPKIHVQKVEPNDELMNLHKALLGVAKANNWPVNGHYTGDHYTPHITRKAGRVFEGQGFTVNKLAIVENLGVGSRHIHGSITLEGTK